MLCVFTAMAVSAPLASSGGATTAVPMIVVMLVGVTGAITAFLIAGRAARAATVA